jgi:alginate O-acetyltransferase complex protein AlgI
MMLFTTATYYVFLIAVFFVCWALAGRTKLRIVALIASSCFFYCLGGRWALLLLVGVSLVDFTTTRFMTTATRARRLLLFISLTIDLGALCFFKYANFLIESAREGLALLGVSAPAALNIIAPLGISFFVFQSVAYVVDVYRRDAEPAENYLEYLAFVSFFPTIVAGPILRARQLLPQLRERVSLDPVLGGQALFLIATGLTKKIAIADYISANLVDRVFDFPERFSSLEVLAAIYGYAVQIYADFSGYSDIAIGSAMLLGYTLPENFNSPYRARNLPDFWRRWHISLSTWLRDYVFFAVAGRRARNTPLLYLGLIVTMLIGGLWHGAAWTFVIWGLLHGVGLAAYRSFESLRKTRAAGRRPSRFSLVFSTVVTFHFVCFAWIFFRSETVDRAVGILSGLSRLTVDTSNLSAPLLIVISIGLLAQLLPPKLHEGIRDGFVRLPAIAQACAIFLLAIGLYLVASSDVAPFIYARF